VSFSAGNESDLEVKFLFSIATIKSWIFLQQYNGGPPNSFGACQRFVSPQKLGRTLHYTHTERAMPYVEPPARTSQILHHLYAVRGLIIVTVLANA
jgi:hypothetical protein